MARTVSRNKIKQIEVLGNPDNESRIQEFYNGLLDNKFNSDTDAALHFFGTKDTSDPRLRKLKSKLIRQLINTSLFVDINQPMFNERAKAYYNCYRDFASAHILTLRDAILAAIDIFEQILEQTIKYEFVDLTADTARELRKLYARVSGDLSKHERISAIQRQYEEKRRLEMLALDHYESLINYYIVRRSPNQEVNAYATAYFDELFPLAAQADTSQYYLFTYNIGMIRHFSANDCVGALNMCEEALSILKARKNTNRAALSTVALQKIACLIQLRRFDADCDETVQYCASLVDEGHLNWFRAYELQIHYCLFARRYEDALEIFSRTFKQEKFASLGGIVRDNWQLYGGYLHLLALLGKLDPKKVVEAVGEFKYSKLNNEIEVVAKDKQGMNIPLILLPVVYALVKGDFEETDISPEGLDKYRKRYLNTDMNKRSAAFLNLLLAFAKKDYSSASAEKKIKKELEVLASEQPQVAGQTFAVEIIPYEDLWEMMVEGGR